MASPHRRYKAGERIVLGAESVLEVISGAVALTVLHEDGAEVLLGLLGPGEVLAGHPKETSCLQIYALAETVVWVQPWSKAVLQPGFADRLRDRLRSLEAWAAMQARPSLERRLLGLLSLLAGQFGRPTSEGVRIEVGITHHQLALAVGATRSTVTRLLGRLRRRGLLIAVRHGRGERYCLPRPKGREGPERCDLAPVHRHALF
ncbi:MAG TPA: Crp/Fnr family transcriptional regulator [Thermoanaerobaculia bacterium]|jgi:CRP-like cAMP-binding protein